MLKKIYYIFDKDDRKKTVELFGYMAIGSLLEALSISLILPFIGIANNHSNVHSNKWLSKLQELLAPGNQQQFLIWLGCILLGVFIFKNVYLVFQYYIQNRFIYDQQAKISGNLLKYYLYSPYTFHFQRNTAELLRNLTLSLGTMFGSGVIPFITIMTELMVVIAITTLLLFVEPLATVFAMVVLGGLTGIFYRQVRRKVGLYGDIVQESSAQMILWANQSLGGVKEIKLLGRESYFLNSFLKFRYINSRNNVFFATIQRVPRLYLEIMLIGGILFIMIIIMGQGDELRSLIPIIGLFAMASVRLMPSITQIVSAMNAMKFGRAAVEDIYEDVTHLREYSALENDSNMVDGIGFDKDITFKDLTYTYPSSNNAALDGISLTISRGMSVAFVGPSGAGKTTLIDILLGLLTPTAGKLLIDDRDIHTSRELLFGWQKKIGYVPQDIYLIDDSLKRNIAFGIDDKKIDNKRVFQTIIQVRLETLVDSMPKGVDTYIGERGVRLSGGQRQRIIIARALYHNPDVLVMDEATSSLDSETESEISKAIDEISDKKTAIIISHRISTIIKCKRIYFIDKGRILDSGTFDELVKNNADFRRVTQQTVK
jgi:ATP-binding cassette, subfamily B, bacterial PglK